MIEPIINILTGFILLVKIEGSDGVIRIQPGSEVYETKGQCIYVANQLKIATTSYQFDEKVVGAGCADCKHFPLFCIEGI